MTRFGLYLHIPFCRAKCIYCDFPSYAGMDRWQTAVTDRMIEELRSGCSDLGPRVPTTVYIGGGTPSTLSPELFSRLMQAAREAFPWTDGTEVSVEMNPGTVTAAFLEAARAAGVNRVSLGAQSASDRLLRRIGRIHRAEDIASAVSLLHKKGFDNINLDMMIGLPDQTLANVRDTLAFLLALQPTHLSCYSLIVEEGTPLFDEVSSGRCLLPDEDLERDMFALAQETLEQAGYHRYEISNFALDGFECRHNVDCWQRAEYLGVGVSAASLIGHERRRNPSTISAYLQRHQPEIIPLNPEDERFESVMLGLRMTSGLRDRDFYERHGLRLIDAYGPVISRLISDGLLTWQGDSLQCTPRGLDLQNQVLLPFLDPS